MAATQFHLRSEGGRPVVVAVGEVDAHVVPEFRETVQRALASSHLGIVLDLRDVTFIDSSGIAVIALTTKLSRYRDTVTIRNAPPLVVRLVELTGLSRYLTIEDAA